MRAGLSPSGRRPPRLTDVVREMSVVRLGQGVDATGELAQEALERTFAATQEYAGAHPQHGAERVRFVATSATRDAGNRQVFVDGIRDLLGVEPEVITGDEEAALSFAGAEQCPALPRGGRCWWWTSAAAARSSCWAPPTASWPPERSTWAACGYRTAPAQRPAHRGADRRRRGRRRAAISEAARTCRWTRHRVVGVAGRSPPSPRTPCACRSTRPAAIHGTELDWTRSRRACTELLDMTRAERAALPYMHPGGWT